MSGTNEVAIGVLPSRFCLLLQVPGCFPFPLAISVETTDTGPGIAPCRRQPTSRGSTLVPRPGPRGGPAGRPARCRAASDSRGGIRRQPAEQRRAHDTTGRDSNAGAIMGVLRQARQQVGRDRDIAPERPPGPGIGIVRQNAQSAGRAGRPLGISESHLGISPARALHPLVRRHVHPARVMADRGALPTHGPPSSTAEIRWAAMATRAVGWCDDSSATQIIALLHAVYRRWSRPPPID